MLSLVGNGRTYALHAGDAIENVAEYEFRCE